MMKSTRAETAGKSDGQDKVDFMMTPPSVTTSMDSVPVPDRRRFTKRNFFVYVAQLVVISIVILVSLLNLSVGWSKENKEMWLALLCSCLGYMLPSPTFKRKV